MTITSTLSAILVLASINQSNFRITDSLSTLQGEITSDVAYSEAKRLANQLGMTISEPAQLRLAKSPVFGRQWEVLWDGQGEIHLNPRTKGLNIFVNSKKLESLSDNPVGESVSMLLGTDELARQRAQSVLEQFASGSSFTMEVTRFKPATAERRPTVFATVHPVRIGRKVSPCSMNVLIDRTDGSIVEIQRFWEFVVESETVVIHAQDAIVRARQAYTQTLPEFDRYAPATEAPKLEYLKPNGQYGGLNYSDRLPPTRVRLAYAVKFGRDEVWIDASNGDVLGGAKNRIRP